MKISAWHRQRGDKVEWWNGFETYDRVYMSRVFTDEYTRDWAWPIQASEIIRGGTGYENDKPLPDDIEHTYPDYELYPQYTEAYGFLTRGCPRGCGFCIVSGKEGRRSVQVADVSEFWRGQQTIKLLDPNLLACPNRMELLRQLTETGALIDFTQGLDIRLVDEAVVTALKAIKSRTRLHFAWDNPEDTETYRRLKWFAREYGVHSQRETVYILANYQSTPEQDEMRVRKVFELGYRPYLMIYNKTHADVRLRKMQRWANCPMILRKVPRFADYTA